MNELLYLAVLLYTYMCDEHNVDVVYHRHGRSGTVFSLSRPEVHILSTELS